MATLLYEYIKKNTFFWNHQFGHFVSLLNTHIHPSSFRYKEIAPAHMLAVVAQYKVTQNSNKKKMYPTTRKLIWWTHLLNVRDVWWWQQHHHRAAKVILTTSYTAHTHLPYYAIHGWFEFVSVHPWISFFFFLWIRMCCA